MSKETQITKDKDGLRPTHQPSIPAHHPSAGLALIEAGFQYVTEMDGTKLFRKRK